MGNSVVRERSPGLRERKKQQTRELIGAAAQQLFIVHGFDAVTIDDVAAASTVARKTVFNYFATKEDLFFSSVERMEFNLLATLENRPLGQSVVASFSEWITNLRWEWGLAPDDAEAYERLRSLSRVISQTPVLLAHERRIYDRYTKVVAILIAKEMNTDAEVIPWAIGNALIGVFRALSEHARQRMLDGDDPAKIAADLRKQAADAMAQLRRTF